ncbi:MAG: DUF1614 domain-containing protein, partial [Gammaproteobacteria bacterium]|nr:DUF1614 domain-containing protein [Gammaproteobacteria bacterium]
MGGVLLALRTLICMGIGVLVWYVLVFIVKMPLSGLGILMPVWFGGLAGGIVAVIFSPQQGVMMAFTSGVLLALGFLWVRHGLMDVGLGTNTLVSLWPVWFPAA